MYEICIFDPGGLLPGDRPGGVSTLEGACAAAQELLEQGVGCIELCGAFGPDGARRIIEATGNRIPVGYVTHLPEQEAVYRAAFPND